MHEEGFSADRGRVPECVLRKACCTVSDAHIQKLKNGAAASGAAASWSFRVLTRLPQHRNRLPRSGATLGFCSASASSSFVSNTCIVMHRRKLGFRLLSFRVTQRQAAQQLPGVSLSGTIFHSTAIGFRKGGATLGFYSLPPAAHLAPASSSIRDAATEAPPLS
jgi:hypothetical protein